MPTCVACHRRNIAAPYAGRCEPCYRVNARWGVCACAGAPCRLVNNRCARCNYAHACMAGAIPYNGPNEGHVTCAKVLAEAHRAAYNEPEHVDVWLMPVRNRCLYHAARVIMWRRFGVRAGMLAGPNPGTPGPRRRGGAAALGRHVQRLVVAGHWAPGDAPIVLLGFGAVPNLRRLAAAQRQRLRAFRPSLTRDGGNLAQTPWANGDIPVGNGPLVQLCQLLVNQLGLGGRVPRPPGAQQGPERRFRRSLHVSPFPAFH